MRVLYTRDYGSHRPKWEYYDGQKTEYAEKAERIDSILSGLQRAGYQLEQCAIPQNCAVPTSLHGKRYVDFLKQKCAAIPVGGELISSVYIGDTYSPVTHGTYKAALASANLALFAARQLQANPNHAIYALCRPPGHHAEHSSMEGYCYFNNAAIAAKHLSKTAKVTILDIDYHHGNGTQKFFYTSGKVQYVSLHINPEIGYPYKSGYENERGKGRGLGKNLNLPLAKDCDITHYLAALTKAAAAIRAHQPEYLIVSLGYDTFVDDPIAGFDLRAEDYTQIGAFLATNTAYPTLFIQEGGYNVGMLGTLAANIMNGYNSKKKG